MRDWIQRILFWLSLIGIIVSIFMIFFYAPIDRNLGIVQKIFYFHLPVAITPYLAFFVVFICSIFFLWKRERRWDVIALASAEIGLVIDTALLVTGTIWDKPTWGVWWVWEPRLTTSLIMWLLYAGYLLLRRSVGEEARRARFAAVYGIVAFISVPISFMSIRWWRTLHPLVFKPTGIELEPPMVFTVFVCLIAFFLFYLCLLRQRIGLEFLREGIEDLKDRFGGG
ncbi:MAG TPA: cytochrome C assembly protein [Actinobacteria bacterium]|nr:cytochrome C assembly protein [Actinomycetota bacterium]